MYQRKNYLNVADSDIFYRCLGFKFYFSSEARRKKFIDNVENYIKEESIKFLNRYDINIEGFEPLFAFSLYHKIETKGVKVEQLLEDRIIKRTFSEIPTFTIFGFGGDEID